MNDQYKYVEKSLTPNMARELIQELFAGQTVQKQEIVRGVDKTHLERGGLPPKAKHIHPITMALSAMKRSGLADNPKPGFWFILSEKSTYIETLDEFMGWARNFDSGRYVFRGVPNDGYGIQASAYRRPAKKDRNFEKFHQVNRDLIRDARLRGYDQKDGRELKELEILAELQHLGAATCLIDFSHSAQIALWFACLIDSDTSQETTQPNGKVFAIHNQPPRFKEISPKLLSEDIDYFLKDSKESQLYHWQPRHQNNRIIMQQSIFLFGHFEFDADHQCVIAADSKQKIFGELDQVSGITEDRLFPDIEGFSRVRSEKAPYTELTATQYKDRGFLAYERGDYEDAIVDYDLAIGKNPNYTEAYYERGLAKAAQERYEEAVADYDEAIHLQSEDNEEFYQARGDANFNLKRYTSAIEDYSEVIRIFPNDINSYYYRGRAKSAQKQYEGAIVDYDEAIRRSPRNLYIYRSRGWAKYQLKQYKAAIDDYNEAIRIYDDRKSYYKRGLANFGLEEYELAISDYDKAISLSNLLNMDPDNAYIYYERALAKNELGRFEEAITDLQTAFPLAMRIANDDSELAVVINDLLRELRSHIGESQ